MARALLRSFLVLFVLFCLYAFRYVCNVYGYMYLKIVTVSEMFGKQLMQISGMSAEKAAAVIDSYPTPKRYVQVILEKLKINYYLAPNHCLLFIHCSGLQWHYY